MGKRCRHVVVSGAILLACCARAFASEHTEGKAQTTPSRLQKSPVQHGDVPVREPKFSHLTTSGGLAQDNVVAALQDHRGFMWFATGGGLNRYDGNAFVVYQNNPDDPNTLSANSTQGLIEDDRGNLWIGIWGGGLDKFDPTTERFTHYRYDPDDSSSISGDRVRPARETVAAICGLGPLTPA